MSNISFANVHLLWIGLGAILVIVVAFFLAIRRGSFNFHNVGSFVLHILITALVTLAIAEMTLRITITETNVYVLADVSYSSHENLDEIDEYIVDLNKNLPKNSKLGVVCFGKDAVELVKPGENLISVKEATVDDSMTDIAEAFRYTATLFKDGVIKRIVLISDGAETNDGSISALIEDLGSQNIYIDAIYLDNNLKEEQNEIQISNVTATKNTFIGKDEAATATILSNRDSKATITLYKNGVFERKVTESLAKGTNVVSIPLDTSIEGEMKYTIEVTPFDEGNSESYDTSTYNNTYTFTQDVTKEVNVLFISDVDEDLVEFLDLYNISSESVDSYIGVKSIPYRIEDLCTYDVIVLSNVDISALSNAENFVYNLDTAVSEFGKSLITLGNVHIQNGETSEVLRTLGSMLPVKFDTQDNTKRLYSVIIDISKSMMQIGHMEMAKTSACAILDLLTENDDFVVIAFYGNVELAYPVSNATEENITAAKVAINNLQAKQATNIAAGLKRCYDLTSALGYQKKEGVIISDGRTYSQDVTSVTDYATKLGEANNHISAVYTADHDYDPESADLKKISNLSGGKYYQVHDLETASKLVTEEIADDVKENHKVGDFITSVRKPKNELVEGVDSALPNIKDFYTSINKTTATEVIAVYEKSVDYPLYSTWSYGNGMVSTFTVNPSSYGIDSFKASEGGKTIFGNMLGCNAPSERIYSPFLFETEITGTIAQVRVLAPTVSSSSKLTLEIIYPDGSKTTKEMSFDSEAYITNIETSFAGEYTLNVTCETGLLTYTGSERLTVSFLPEYDSFQAYDASSLYTMVTQGGKVSEDGKLSISNEGIAVSTFTYSFAPLFFVISLILFVVDIIIRKLRWQDIKNLFVHSKKGAVK